MKNRRATDHCTAIRWLVHWPLNLMGGLLHLVQRWGDWAGPQPAQALLAVPNVTVHPSTASVPITVLLYNGPLLFGVNVAIKGLTKQSFVRVFSRFASLQAHGVQKTWLPKRYRLTRGRSVFFWTGHIIRGSVFIATYSKRCNCNFFCFSHRNIF